MMWAANLQPVSFAARWSATPLCAVFFAAAAAAQQPAAHPSPQRAPQAQPMPNPQASPAVAQPTPSAQPAQGNLPQRTTATYDDWIVQCDAQSGGASHKFCEMTQVTQFQGNNQPFSRIAVLRPTKEQSRRLVVQVPVNVTFSANVRVQINDSDPGLVGPFARCVPGGCFAEFDLKDDAVKKFRSTNTAGKLSFADAGGHNISVPVSFKGFGQAYDALMAERD